MFRAKISLVVAAILLVLGGVGYVVVTSRLTEMAKKEMQGQLGRSQKLISQVSRLDAIDFAALAASLARDPEFAKSMAIADLTQKRQALFVALEAHNGKLAKDTRKADLMAVTDSAGRVLVRDLNPNAMYQEDFRAKYPSLALALAGSPNKDIWTIQDRSMRVASAPLRGPDGQVQGALVVGFVITDKEARHKRKDFGAEVVFLIDGKAIASSFVAEGEGDNAKEDVGRAKEVAAVIAASPAAAAVQSGKSSDVFSIRIGGEEYLAAVEPLPGNATAKTAAAALLIPVAQRMRPIERAGTTILLVVGLCVLVGIAGTVLTARRFLGPLDQLETGVAEVINGNLEYSFDKPSPDYEGFANALNVMLARLLGRPDPGDDEDGDQIAAAKRWKGGSDAMFSDDIDGAEASGGVVADPVTLHLAQEPLESYFKRTYDEYMGAKRKAGEPTDGVSFESFRAKLAQNETALRGKYKCKMVRFRVETKGTQVTLKPVPIY